MMTVPYDAYPRADAEWFHEGTSLPVQNIDTSADKTEYRMKSPRKEDRGRYRILIRNKHGEGEAFINLDVIGESHFLFLSPDHEVSVTPKACSDRELLKSA